VEQGRTYFYRLVTVYEGARIVFGPIEATAGVPIRESAITSIAPNPSTGPIRISYALKAAASARVSIHDVQGREMALLASGEASAGRHQAVWSGETDRGPASAGVYYVRMTASGQTFVKRIVLAR
jgi:cell wall-associated NlpC family hydrolase